MLSMKITSLVAVALACLASDLATAADLDECEICKTYLETVQEDPKHFRPVAEALCKQPFCDNDTECEQFSGLMGIAGFFFKQLSPEQNCKILRVCEFRPTSVFGLLSEALLRPFSSKQSGSLAGKIIGRITASEPCDICEQIVEGFQEDFQVTAQFLQMLCALAPADEQKQCKQLADRIMDKFKTEKPKQFCARIGLCEQRESRWMSLNRFRADAGQASG